MYDCCREKAPGSSGCDSPIEVIEKYNYLAFYGCEPTFTVPAESKLCRTVFGRLRDKAETWKDKGGLIYLPQDVVGFTGDDGRAEMLIKCIPITF